MRVLSGHDVWSVFSLQYGGNAACIGAVCVNTRLYNCIYAMASWFIATNIVNTLCVCVSRRVEGVVPILGMWWSVWTRLENVACFTSTGGSKTLPAISVIQSVYTLSPVVSRSNRNKRECPGLLLWLCLLLELALALADCPKSLLRAPSTFRPEDWQLLLYV